MIPDRTLFISGDSITLLVLYIKELLAGVTPTIDSNTGLAKLIKPVSELHCGLLRSKSDLYHRLEWILDRMSEYMTCLGTESKVLWIKCMYGSKYSAIAWLVGANKVESVFSSAKLRPNENSLYKVVSTLPYSSTAPNTYWACRSTHSLKIDNSGSLAKASSVRSVGYKGSSKT